MIYKHDIQAVFGMQRYFLTFAENPSDSISDVVIQMHFLSLYKGRICVYSTRTKSGKNSYTNSYTKVRNLHGENFKFPDFWSKITTVIQTVIQIVIHGFWGSKKF